MEYPIWFVDLLTAPMLIPVVAIPHVIVAQFAVGGGIVLADMVRRAHRDGEAKVLSFLKKVTRYFVLITVVFGAVTGVGIWWTIGLTSPAATSALIHLFVFFWASEWVMFLVEIVAAFAFYYTWDRLEPNRHIQLGWIYAVTAWLSLVLITGITAFMLTTGGWSPGDGVWIAFFNPSFLPQVLIRTGGSLSIAALWIGLFVSFHDPTPLKDRVIRWISQWALAGMVLLLIGGLAYFWVLPDRVQLNLLRAPILIMMTVLNFGVTLLVLGALGSGIVAGSRWITPPAAGLLLLAGMVAIGTGEFIREGSRKPFLIQDYMFSPGIRVAEVTAVRRRGLIESSPWLNHYLRRTIGPDPTTEAQVSGSVRVQIGRGVFRYHCSSCHATVGYNGIVPIIQPWSVRMIRDATRNLHRANPAMPPWFGDEFERRALAAYLIHLREKWPIGESSYGFDS